MVFDYCSQNAFFGKGDCALLDFASTDFQDFLIFPNFLGSSFLWFWAIHEATYMKFFLIGYQVSFCDSVGRDIEIAVYLE